MRLREARRQVGVEVVLVRLGAAVAGLIALGVAMPDVVLAHPAGPAGMVALAALVGLAPRGPWVTATVLVAVAGWLVATSGFGEPVRPGRVLALAAALYLLHSLAALAAAVPFDAQVAGDVLGWWLARAGLVVLVASVLSTAVLAGAGNWTLDGHELATVVGLLLAAALAALLAGFGRS